MYARSPGSDYGAYSNPPDEDQWRLSARDRVLPPARRGRRKLVWACIAMLAAGAGAYAMQSPEPVVPEWLQKEAIHLFASLQNAAAKAIATRAQEPAATASPTADTALPDASADQSTPPLPPPKAPPADAIEAPPVAAAPVVVTTAALPPSATARPAESDAAKPAAPSDPLRLKAEAVGLHPDLSRALLERLTPADFQNAGTAVAKALAQTSDNGVLVWPQRAKQGVAVFEVRFVAGAPTGCRRYIVSILKDRWTTTAMPIDKCGPASQVVERR